MELPSALLLPLLQLLPAAARARACCVCRAWRAAGAEPAAWSSLDFCDLPLRSPLTDHPGGVGLHPGTHTQVEVTLWRGTPA